MVQLNSEKCMKKIYKITIQTNVSNIFSRANIQQTYDLQEPKELEINENDTKKLPHAMAFKKVS